MFTLRYLQPDINPIVFATGINNTSETGGKIAAGVVDTGCPLSYRLCSLWGEGEGLKCIRYP